MRTTWKILGLTLGLGLGCGGGDASDEPAGDDTAGGEHGHPHGEHGHPHGEHGHHGEHGPDHHGDHHHAMAEAQTAFHDVFAPLWHSEAGPERAQRACDQLDELARLGAAAADATTEGIEAPEPSDAQIATDMRAAFDALRAEGCAGETPALEAVDTHLGNVHDVFHRAMERWQELHASE